MILEKPCTSGQALHDRPISLPVDSNTQGRRPKTLVLYHCFYTNMFDEINRYIANLDGATDYDVVVSVPTESDELAKQIHRRFSSYTVLLVDNRGQDVGAAIDAIRAIDLSSYDYILKVHTKKNRRPRRTWRQDLLQPLLGSKEAVHVALNVLARSDVSMVGSRKLFVNKVYGNGNNLQKLTERLQLEDWDGERHRFFAGCIFWTKVQVFERIKAAGFTIQDFEPGYQPDLLLQHAFERVFGILAVHDGQKIIPL